MTKKDSENAHLNTILDSNTSSEEDVAEYMRTLSPEERELYIDYMISTNKDVAEQKRKRDSEIIAQMRAKEALELIDNEIPEHDDENDTQISPENDKNLEEHPEEQPPVILEDKAQQSEDTPPAGYLFGKSKSYHPDSDFTDMEIRSLEETAGNAKKRSHVMLYIAIGCFIFLVLLIIAAKIILAPSVTVAIK